VPLVQSDQELLETIDHENCREEESTECTQCLARRCLDPADWPIVYFFSDVVDQKVCLTPMGDADTGRYRYAPRLEAWETVLRLREVPREERPLFVEQARAMFYHLHQKTEMGAVMSASVEDLKALDDESPA
jgi:hypothetical protein